MDETVYRYIDRNISIAVKKKYPNYFFSVQEVDKGWKLVLQLLKDDSISEANRFAEELGKQLNANILLFIK